MSGQFHEPLLDKFLKKDRYYRVDSKNNGPASSCCDSWGMVCSNPTIFTEFFWHTFWCCQISKIIKSIEELVLLSLWFPKICWEKKTHWLLMSKTSRDVKPFSADFHPFFAGGKKTSIFWHRVSVIQIMDENSPKRLGVNLQKNSAVRGWNLQNTRIVPNPGDVLVVDSQLILFTYYNTEDSEWMNHQINQRQLSMLVCASKTLSNPTLVEKYKLHLIRLLAFQEGAVAAPRRAEKSWLLLHAIILCLYILLYIDYHILSLYLKIYIPHRPPPSSLTKAQLKL